MALKRGLASVRKGNLTKAANRAIRQVEAELRDMAELERAHRANEAGAAARTELQARYDAEDAEEALGANLRGRHVVPARRSASPRRERVQSGAADIQQGGQQGGVGGGNNNFYPGEFGPQQGGSVQDQQGRFQQGGGVQPQFSNQPPGFGRYGNMDPQSGGFGAQGGYNPFIRQGVDVYGNPVSDQFGHMVPGGQGWQNQMGAPQQNLGAGVPLPFQQQGQGHGGPQGVWQHQPGQWMGPGHVNLGQGGQAFGAGQNLAGIPGAVGFPNNAPAGSQLLGDNGALPPFIMRVVDTLPPEHQKYIVQIAKGTFKLSDLHLLDEASQWLEEDKGVISFNRETGTWYIGKKKSVKVYGTNPSRWQRCFINYQAYVLELYAPFYPEARLPLQLSTFLNSVLRLAEVWIWNEVINLALFWHDRVVARGGLRGLHGWKIPDTWISRYCRTKRCKEGGSGRGGKGKYKDEKAKQLCYKETKGSGCTDPACVRIHPEGKRLSKGGKVKEEKNE
ncbi:hypothetical protein HYALB_00013626 [Hymenoscyphus albidus]|uniref:C3H1-type domain-containing protein n=1 Tax=Hymenoscyphus albidus TaxID=595503 RepID=A0A9N9LVH8_9HELO|nr:hypothetical protein HYALB_00013626 [Hymenoscyphus albidus]